MTRPATGADLEALHALELRAFGEAAWSRASLASQLADDDSWIAVSPASGPIQASVTLRRAADEAELLRVGVHPRARRRGLASGLLTEGFAWASRMGARRVFLEVSARNEPALALYLAHGFAPCGRRRGYYGPGEDALLLSLDLGALDSV